MSILIKGMEMPIDNPIRIILNPNGQAIKANAVDYEEYEAVALPSHGRLIDADALRAKMYHDAFETDSPLQKWDSGCWIRYKMFEDNEENAPTVIPADKDGET